MRIDEVLGILRRSNMNWTYYVGDGGVHFTFNDLADAIEQNHKDLMGLVEALRESAREDFDKSKNMNWSEWVRDRAFGEAQGKFKAADQLESLINPKD